MRSCAALMLLALTTTAACRPGASSDLEKAADGLDASNERARAKAREQLARGEAVDVSAEADATVAQVEAAAKTTTGDEKLLLEASAEILRVIKDSSDRHQAGITAFVETGGLDPAGIRTSADASTRLEKLDAFCKENDAMRDLVRRLPDEYERIAAAKGVGDDMRRGARDGFMKGFPQADILQMRELDGRFCGAARSQLGVMKDAAGHFDVDAAGNVTFDETVAQSTLDSFNSAGASIQSIVAEQETVQKRIFAK